MGTVTGAITLSKQYDGCKVFSATKARERVGIGDRVTEWVREVAKKGWYVVGTVVRQSSDREYHCLSVVVFYNRGE
jgi:hypothetical protein